LNLVAKVQDYLEIRNIPPHKQTLSSPIITYIF